MVQAISALAVLLMLMASPVWADRTQGESKQLVQLLGEWQFIIRTPSGSRTNRYIFDKLTHTPSGSMLEGWHPVTQSKINVTLNTKVQPLNQLTMHDFFMSTSENTTESDILCFSFYFSHAHVDHSTQLIYGSAVIATSKRTEQGNEMASLGLPGFDCFQSKNDQATAFIGIQR